MPTTVGLLLRISDDRDQTEAGITRQEADCRALARTRDWQVTEVYRENDTSAFKRRKVQLPDGTTALRVLRPEFRRMLNDLASGRVDAVIGYHLDRVARDPRDLEDLIDVCETTNRPVLTVGGSVDLSNDGGITLARVAVAVANQSSRDASRRIRRAKEANAASGKWNGGGIRAYGYTRDRTEIIPEEATILRELCARFLAGESMRSILADLRARDLPTVTGRQWSSAAILRMLKSGVMAGRLSYRGQDVGPAPWPAIIDDDTYQAVLANLAARPKNDTSLRHWLTGVVVCGLCGHNLRGNSGAYLCEKATGGCNRIWVGQHLIETLIEAAIIGRVKRRRPPRVKHTPVAADDQQLEELAAMWGAQEISLTEYRAARAKITERLKAQQPVRVPAWVNADLADTWPSLTPTQRNGAAKALLESVVVGPSPTRRWDPTRVTYTWR